MGVGVPVVVLLLRRRLPVVVLLLFPWAPDPLLVLVVSRWKSVVARVRVAHVADVVVVHVLARVPALARVVVGLVVVVVVVSGAGLEGAVGAGSHHGRPRGANLDVPGAHHIIVALVVVVVVFRAGLEGAVGAGSHHGRPRGAILDVPRATHIIVKKIVAVLEGVRVVIGNRIGHHIGHSIVTAARAVAERVVIGNHLDHHIVHIIVTAGGVAVEIVTAVVVRSVLGICIWALGASSGGQERAGRGKGEKG